MKCTLRIITLVFAVAALVALAGCGGSAASPPATGGSTSAPAGSDSAAPGTAVTIANFTFSPTDVTVKVGDSVTWTNNDSAAHTVAFADFDSGQIAPGATYTHKFDTAGTFDYKCSIHPSMTAKVTVQ